MNRQIKTCAFSVGLDDGTSINVINGFPVNVATYSGSYTFRPYFHTGSPYDEAITGRLRSQLGGYRFEATLAWERLIDQDPLLNVINNAFTSTNNEVVITFFPDASNTAINTAVVVEDLIWDSQITGTIVRQPISVRLRGRDVVPSIPSFFTL